MNQIEANFSSLLDMGMDVLAEALRDVSAGDLQFVPPGENVSLRDLCVGMGNVAYAYARSYRSGRMDFSLQADGRDAPATGSEVADWIRASEGLLKEAVHAYSDDELTAKTIDRGDGWKIPLLTQFHVYREALLIFFGKLDIYLRLINKRRPERWVQWVG